MKNIFIKGVSFDRSKLRKEIGRKINSRDIQTLAFQQANNEVQEAKNQVIESFENHPVTKEIRAGKDSDNTSGTLSGRTGNLYTFIGFRGGDPTKLISRHLRTRIKIFKNSKFVKRGQLSGKFQFRVNVPSLEEMHRQTPMPWQKGISWLKGIENGISGLSHYIYRKLISASRSGSAVQVKGEVSRSVFKPIKYVSEIINKFFNKIDKLKQ